MTISAIIFTLNEEVHLPSCLASLDWCDDVIVVDSFSADATESICRAADVRFFQNRFEGFGTQRNWALANCSPRYGWVLILDADERTPPALVAEMNEAVSTAGDAVGAFRVRRRFHMWGRWLRFSSLYPTWVVRLIRVGRVHYSNRGHAETQFVQGSVLDLRSDLIDENLKGIDDWFERQNRYSSREAEWELERDRAGLDWYGLLSLDPMRRRSSLKHLASWLPFRPLFYFLYSFVFRGGFLEGRDGFIFCLMKATYQRMIVIKKYDLMRTRAK